MRTHQKVVSQLGSSLEFSMTTPSISCFFQRILNWLFRLPFLAMGDNAESHYACSLLSSHRRAGLSDMLQRCSRALLSACSCMSLGTFCPAGICQPHDHLQAKGNCSCQEWLCEFSLTDDFLLLLLFNSLSFSFRLSVFCINCILRARSTVMHVYVSQADSSNVLPLQWFCFFIPNAFEIIAEEVPQFFSRAMNTIFYSHYKSIGWMLLLLFLFRITLYKQLIWFKAVATRLLFKKNVSNCLVQ